MPETEPVAPPTTAPRAEDLEAALKKIQVVDISEAIGAHAIDAADAHLSSETSQHGLKGFAKRIWKGNLARDIIRQRKIQQGRRQIIESENIYAASGGEMADHIKATADVVERFTSEYDLVHRQAGETNEAMEASEHGQALLTQLKQLIVEFAHNPAMGNDALEEAKNRVLHEYGRRVHGNDRNRGLMYADNILEVAAQARFAAQHELARERIEAALSGHIGEARMGVRTKARLETVDKGLDFLHSHGLTFVNEGTLGVGLAVGMTIAKVTSRSALSAAAKMAIPGIGGGLIAGLREHLRVGQERTLHMRQMAEGGEMPAEDAHRRERMEQNRYETISATELSEQLESVGDLLENDDVLAAIAVINAAEIRTGISDQRSLDLISYSSKTSVEGERFALDLSLSQAKVLLNRKLGSLSDEELSSLGLTARDGTAVLAGQAAELTESLFGDITEKDKAFKKLRRQRTLKMAAVGAVAGVSLGLLFQELHSLADGGMRGVTEGPGGDRQSLLAAIFRHGHHPGANTDDFHNEYVNNLHDHHSGLSLPPGYHLVQEKPGGDWDLVNDKGETIYNHFRWDSQGKPAAAVRDYLHAEGWNLQEHHIGYTTHHLETSHVTRSPQEYLRAHPHDFIRAHRQLWYDNNTPGVFDQNELKLDWGAGGVGIDSHGNYVLNVSSMLPDGSFHEGLSTNAQQLVHEGKMAIALSMSHDTQQFVHLVHLNAHGDAVINSHSALGRSLFENQNGHAHFIGGYAEAAQLMGKTPDGGESIRMLATVVGDNHPHQLIDVTHHMSAPVHKEHFITSLIPPEHNPPVEVPPVIPIYSRKGLEDLGDKSAPEEADDSYIELYGASGTEDGYIGPGSSRASREGLAPYASYLEKDPGAKIDANYVFTKYSRGMKPAYRKIIDNLSKQLDKQPKASRPRVVVTIPAAAHQEGNNIYRSLSYYAKQKNVTKDDFEIVVFANYPKGARRDKTIREVERFQRNYPDVKVRLVRRELENDEAKMGWIRRAATDAIIKDLAERGIDLNEVVVVSNDADSEWIDPRYLRTIIDKVAENPDSDGFMGYLDWSHESYNARPELLASTRFWQMLDMYVRIHNKEIGSSGANFAFRPGIYMAVGGYHPHRRLGEDVSLGRMIKNVRSGSTRTPIAWLGRGSTINTSSRRSLDKLLNDGSAPLFQWDDGFGDGPRSRQFDLKAYDFDDKASVQKLVKDTERMLNQTLSAYKASFARKSAPTYKEERLTDLDAEALRNITRMLSVIGLKVQWKAGGSFKITSSERMIDNMRAWQAKHPTAPRPPIFERRRGGGIGLPRLVAAADRAASAESGSRQRLQNE